MQIYKWHLIQRYSRLLSANGFSKCVPRFRPRELLFVFPPTFSFSFNIYTAPDENIMTVMNY